MFCRIIRDGQILSRMNVPRQDVIDRTDLLHIFVHAVVIVCDIFICDIPEGISLLDLDACVIFIRKVLQEPPVCGSFPAGQNRSPMTVKTINPNMNVASLRLYRCSSASHKNTSCHVNRTFISERLLRTFVYVPIIIPEHPFVNKKIEQIFGIYVCIFYTCCVKLNYT